MSAAAISQPDQTSEELKERATSLALIPVPEGGVITPASALRWLETDYLALAPVAYLVAKYSKTKAARSGAVTIALDVHLMVIACTKAITTGQPQRIVRDYGQDEESQMVSELLEVQSLEYEIAEEVGDGDFQRGFDMLAREALARHRALHGLKGEC